MFGTVLQIIYAKRIQRVLGESNTVKEGWDEFVHKELLNKVAFS